MTLPPAAALVALTKIHFGKIYIENINKAGDLMLNGTFEEKR